MDIQLKLKTNIIPINKLGGSDYRGLVEKLKSISIVERVQIENNMIKVIPNEAELAACILNEQIQQRKGKLQIHYEIPAPGTKCTGLHLRIILIAQAIANIKKFFGYTVELKCFFFEWEIEIGFLLEGMKKLNRSLQIDEFDTLEKVLDSGFEDDISIAKENLSNLYKVNSA
ncbi:hypothetical protein HDV01_004328 [Terramyces sp. JEL0728]|nr:hypothetical protein HDV01_004328 [Terramyces sp. JEL0728]